MDTWPPLLAATVLLVGGLFFFGLGVEVLRRYSGVRLKEMLFHRPATAERVERRLAAEEDLLSAALGCLTLVEVGLVAVLAALLSEVTALPAGARLLSAVALTVGAVVVLRRGVAGALADHRAEELLVALLPALGATAAVMRPFGAVERFVNKVVTRLMGESENRSHREAIHQEILSAVDEAEREGLFPGEQAEMIEGILSLRKLDVRDVMTPRTDLVWLDAGATLADAVRVVRESGHSRIPAFSGSRDNVVGVLYAKDLLAPLSDSASPGEVPVAELLRPPLFVPETKPVWQLLQEFRRGRRHVAIVVDEYGGTAGLVTVEDILEEVVGEISDEYDQGEAPSFRRISGTAADVDARLRVDELNSEMGIHIPEKEEYDTVGGLALNVLGRVPAEGERFRVEDVDFTILKADDHRIHRLRVEVRPEEEGE